MFFRDRLISRVLKCVLPQSYNRKKRVKKPSERMSLCVSTKGSLTVEAALMLPFFITILLAFFSFFSQYASAVQLGMQAAAEAKNIAVTTGRNTSQSSGDITIYKFQQLDSPGGNFFRRGSRVKQRAVCRRWTGFTELRVDEIYVYETLNGSVYHLFRDCTHLDLSIQNTTLNNAKKEKNENGNSYRECELCDEPFDAVVYITKEGECYHSERTCSGLKRTVRQVEMSKVAGKDCCLRCQERGS